MRLCVFNMRTFDKATQVTGNISRLIPLLQSRGQFNPISLHFPHTFIQFTKFSSYDFAYFSTRALAGALISDDSLDLV